MKRFLSLLVFLFSLYSCSVPNYYVENKTQDFGVDFTNGKWMLNKIDAPLQVEDKLKENALHDFKALLGDRLIAIEDVQGQLLPKKIPLQPTKETLKELKIGTNFDYIINLKASNLKQDFDSVSLTNYKFQNGEINSNEVILEIYDLSLLEIIYSQKVIGSASIPEKSSSDVHFSKSSNSLILGAYKKLMKELKNKSIK